MEGKTNDPVSDAPSCDNDVAVEGPEVVDVVGAVVVVVEELRLSSYATPATAAAATATTPSVRRRNVRRLGRGDPLYESRRKTGGFDPLIVQLWHW